MPKQFPLHGIVTLLVLPVVLTEFQNEAACDVVASAPHSEYSISGMLCAFALRLDDGRISSAVDYAAHYLRALTDKEPTDESTPGLLMCAQWSPRVAVMAQRVSSLVDAAGNLSYSSLEVDYEVQTKQRELIVNISRLWFYAALCMSDTGDTRGAVEALQKSLAFVDQNTGASLHLAQLWAQEGKTTEAAHTLAGVLMGRESAKLTDTVIVESATGLLALLKVTPEQGEGMHGLLDSADALAMEVVALEALGADEAMSARAKLQELRQAIGCKYQAELPLVVLGCKNEESDRLLGQAPAMMFDPKATTLTSLLDEYAEWHKLVVAWLKEDTGRCHHARSLVFVPKLGMGNRMHALLSAFMTALVTGRLFFVDWRYPTDWSDLFSAPSGGWDWDWTKVQAEGLVCAEATTVTLEGAIPDAGTTSQDGLYAEKHFLDRLWTYNCHARSHTLSQVLFPDASVLRFDGYQRIRFPPDNGFVSVAHTSKVSDIFSDNCVDFDPRIEPRPGEKGILEIVTNNGMRSIYEGLWKEVARPSPHVSSMISSAFLHLSQSSFCIGMHIRMGSAHTSGYQILSPQDEEKFIRVADAAAAEAGHPDYAVFLMTDSYSVLDNFTKVYGDRLIHVEGNITHSLGGGTFQAIRKVNADMTLLGECNYTIISAYSTLGEFGVARTGAPYCSIADSNCNRPDRHRCPHTRMKPCSEVWP